MRYAAAEEGELASQHTAAVPPDVDRDRVSFRHADPVALPPDLGQFDAVLAAHLLCRSADPAAVLAALSALVAPGGALVLASSYDWQEAATPRGRWLGGFASKVRGSGGGAGPSLPVCTLDRSTQLHQQVARAWRELQRARSDPVTSPPYASLRCCAGRGAGVERGARGGAAGPRL